MEKLLNLFSNKTAKQSSRLKPINKRPKNQNVFHNITFIIFCPKHRKIAFSDNFDSKRELAVWYPFVYLSSDIKKRITVEESVSLILSDGDPQLMAQYKMEQPFDSYHTFLFCARIKEYNFGFTRSVYLVRLHSNNPVLHCCSKTSRIVWLDTKKIFNNYTDCFWAPILQYNDCRRFVKHIKEMQLDYYMYTQFFTPLFSDQILESLNITEKQIQLLYIDFIEHCFPSIFMSFISFKDYLRKYDFITNEKTMKRLFYGFMQKVYFTDHPGFHLLFEELILGLAHIDPQCVFKWRRLQFVFRYYDIDCDGFLNREEFRELIEDIHENETSDMIDHIVNDYWFIISPSDKGVDYEQFLEYVYNQSIIIPLSLCRFEFRVLLKIMSILETKNDGIVSRIKKFVSKYCS